MNRFVQAINILVFLSSQSFSANILGIVTTPSLSHQIPFQPLWKELSLRGHNVTVLTTHPIGDSSLKNLTEIDLHNLFGFLQTNTLLDLARRNLNLKTMSSIFKHCNNIFTKVILEDKRIQELINKDYHFDLVVAEVHLTTMLAFAWRFKCPWIGITSLDAPRYYHYVMGNPIHPVLNPDFNFRVTNPNGLTFLEKLYSLAFNIHFYLDPICPGYMEESTENLKEYFGNDIPPLKEIVHNISMLFINTHPLTHNIGPLQPNTVRIGTGMQIKEPKTLPKSFSANILGIVTTPSLSHQIPFQPLWKELSLRGHNVTVLTTHPIGDSSLKNLTEIDLHNLFGFLQTNTLLDLARRNLNLKTMSSIFKHCNNIFTKVILEDKRIQELINKDYHFDLVVAEVHLTTMLAFAWRFKCPWIGITSLDAPRYYHYVMGNPIHPVLNPDFNFRVTNPNGLTFLEKLYSLAFNIHFYLDPICPGYMEESTENLKEYFGNDIPPLKEIDHNISMLFINTHPLTHNIGPLQPNTVRIGTGMHIKEPKTLPKSFSANILGLVTIPSLSHQIPFQPLWKELSLRGHNVTVLTTHPIGDSSLKNLTEIHLHNLFGILQTKTLLDLARRNLNLKTMSSTFKHYNNIFTKVILEDKRIQELINKDYHFDLVVAEVHLTTMLAFAWRFKCPWIGITSLDAPRYYHYVMGNPIHPVLNPDFNFRVTNPNGLTILEKLYSLAFNIHFYLDPVCSGYMEESTENLKGYFGNDMPPLKEIVHNISMLFINTHPLTHNIGPLQPNTVRIGTGMQIKEPKTLPKDVQEFMDQATNGVIYCSFGGNIKHELLKNMSFFKNLVEGLGELKYKVLLKIDEDMETVPENFKTGKWMPQQDILRHENLKLFIFHGGLQSFQEAIYNGIPVIALPIFGDGFSNANKAAQMGYGLKLDINTLSKQNFKDAVEEVIGNPKYREKIQEAMRIYRDEEVPSLQRAVYWTEYVIRHKGARHLRNPFLDMPAWEYYMIDIFTSIAIVLGIIIFVIYKVVRLGFFLLFRKNNFKVHKE